MKTRYKVLIGFLALIIIIRLILPYVVLHYANKKLTNVRGYYGHIKETDLYLFRGAFSIKDIYVNKIDTTSNKQTNFFKSNSIEFSLEWGALFKGAIVGKLAINSPVLIFTKDKVSLEDVKKDSPDFQKQFSSIIPVRLNRFEINNGALHFVDSTFTPVVDVSLKKVHILALNLTNITNDTSELPSTVTAEADVYEGVLTSHTKLDLLAEQPAFVVDVELKSTNLVLLNGFFKAYGKIKVSKGTFGLYTEMAAKDGEFVGYVKPVIKDLELKALEGEDASGFSKIWKGLVGAVASVFENNKKDQLATKIPIEGEFTDPKPNILFAIWEVLQNAFVLALTSSIDNEISLKSVNAE